MSYEPFAAVYDRWVEGAPDDVPFFVELAREADGPVVELAVGSGRVAIPVAQAIGRRVIGIDSSPTMLENARRARGGDLPIYALGTCAISSSRSPRG
jgi:ubiquinone/menaquinone biosynthesis C-methylase UbiE